MLKRTCAHPAVRQALMKAWKTNKPRHLLGSMTGPRWLKAEGKYLVAKSSPVYNVNIVMQQLHQHAPLFCCCIFYKTKTKQKKQQTTTQQLMLCVIVVSTVSHMKRQQLLDKRVQSHVQL